MLCGGGNKGLAYFGALKLFEKNNHKFKRISGTSAGGITSALLAIGYSATEIEQNFISQAKLLDYNDKIMEFF